MSRTALMEFIDKLTRRMGAQMQLCCGRALGNLPSLPPSDRGGRLA